MQLRFLVSLFMWLLVSGALHAEAPIRPGDRIAIVGNTFADQLRIHGYLEALLMQHTQQNPISIRNLGWGGDMLTARDRPTGFPTEESTLKDHKTDVLIACFGMGESFEGDEGLGHFKDQLRAFIDSHKGKSYNGSSEVRLVLVSPIACEDLGRLTPNRKERNQDLESYTRAMIDVGAESSIPVVNLFAPSRYLMDEPAGPNFTTNGIHLNPYGYWALSRTFFEQLIEGENTQRSRSWRITIDANAKTGEGRGVRVFDITSDEAPLRFYVEELSTPSLPPPVRKSLAPTPQSLPPQLQRVRDTLVVTGLDPGNYSLAVDDIHVATASAEAWSEGVPIDASPAHTTADKYRAAINNKNLQFTYSWKALNQVHIVGERKSSPSGKELPKEVIEFKNLANKLDAELRNGIELKTRQWKFMRVEE